MISYTTLTEIL